MKLPLILRSSAFVLALWTFSLAGRAAAQGDRVYRVETSEVRLVEVARTLSLTGTIEAWRDVALAALAGGRIVELPVEEGNAVAEGDLLFAIDARAEKIALDRAEAELEKATAQLEKMEAGSLPEEIRAARKTADAARARLVAASDEWERIRPLLSEGVVSQSEAARARAAADAAEAEVARAEAQLQLVEDGFRSEEVKTAAAEVRVRRSAVEEIRRELADRRVVAPVAGTIVRRAKEPDEWASVGETVVEMVALDPMRLRVEVPQAEVASIAPGQSARLRADGVEGEFAAKVTGVVPRARPDTRNFPVLLEVENHDGRLAAGMFARAEIRVGEGDAALSVPREAIQYRGTALVVYAVEPLPAGFVWNPPAPPPGAKGKGGPPGPPPAKPDAVVREIEVRIAAERAADALIEPVGRLPLAAGNEIVVLGGSLLRDGSLVSRLDAKPAGDAPMPGAG